MRMPFDSAFRISSGYGAWIDPLDSSESWHGGVDLVSSDRYVRTVIGGSVLVSRIVTDPADRTSEWGNYIAIAGDDGMLIYYCHLAARAAEAGRRVEAGQVIGIEGATGRATGVHLHFEVRTPGGIQTDPCRYLGIPNAVGYVWTPPKPWEAQASDWAREAVSWAVEKGILKGRGGDDYALGEPVTREELCVMLWRAREVL